MPMTRSASTGASLASRSPMRTRAPWTSTPASRESGPREVDVLEDAERVPPGRERLRGVQAVGVDADDLARPHVADEIGADEVERARLRGNHPVVPDPAELERTEPERIAEGDQHAVRDRSDRVRALEAGHRVRDRLRAAERGRGRRARR